MTIDPRAVDLCGGWEFRLDPDDIGVAEKWFANNVQFDRRLTVPGAWNAQGVEFPTTAQLHLYENSRETELNRLRELRVLGPEPDSQRIRHVFPGPGWYRRRVAVPNYSQGATARLVFAGVHREGTVWVNGQVVAEHKSYLTPFAVDLSAYAGDAISIVVRIDARRGSNILLGSLDTLDHQHIEWGGIHKAVWIEPAEPFEFHDVFVIPRSSEGIADIQAVITGPVDVYSAPPRMQADIVDRTGSIVATATRSATEPGLLTLRVPAAHLRTWSPQSPYLYTMRLTLRHDRHRLAAASVRFGMRELTVTGSEFRLNGRPFFIRGYGDDCIFPETIAPPADRREFRRRLTTARDYGFNYIRCHSWVPPNEYFDIADELGMFVQPEFPLVKDFRMPTEADRDFVLGEWSDLIRQYRNHPSISAWCMGNELYDSFPLATDMYEAAKRLDPTRPVVESDGSRITADDRKTLDFLVVPFAEESSIGYGDDKYAIDPHVTKPVIAHEMGYFAALPRHIEPERFRAGINPYWLPHEHKDYDRYVAASERLQAICLKTNIEAARRSDLHGISVWLLQDYPNCAEGILDIFCQQKTVDPKWFRQFNNSTVVLIADRARNVRCGETVSVQPIVSRYEDAPTTDALLRWRLESSGNPAAAGTLDHLRINIGRTELPPITLHIPETLGKYTLHFELSDESGSVTNDWDFWAFPSRPQSLPDLPAIGGNLIMTTALDEVADKHLAAGGRVFLIDPEADFEIERTNYRPAAWDGAGQYGTVIDRHHPALRTVPTNNWCDLSFYNLLQQAKSVRLPGSIRNPIIRCLDDPRRQADRGYLFECTVGPGSLLVSGFNFADAITAGDPGAAYLFHSLVEYARGPDFQPRDQFR